MPINFPNNPVLNELYTYDEKIWEWNGLYWEVFSGLTSYVTSITFDSYINSVQPLIFNSITGGTFSLGTLSLINNSGDTIIITGFTSGGEYLPLSGGTVTGPTEFLNGLTSTTVSATTYLGLPEDVYVTGGTYSSGTAEFTNSTGGTFSVSGFSTGGTSSEDVFVTGGTYSAGTATFTNNTGGTFNVTGFTSGGGGTGLQPGSVVGIFKQFAGTQGFEIIPSVDRLWIASNNNNRVDIYEASTGYYLGGIGSITGAFGVIYVSSLNEVWITSSSSTTIQRYDPVTFTSLGSFTSGGNGGLSYVEVSSTKLYICNLNSNSVSDIDPSTLTVTTTITAASMGMTTCNDITYVDNPSSNHHQYLAVVSTAVSEFAAIDTTTNTVAILGTSGGAIVTPYSITYNPVNDRYYITTTSGSFQIQIYIPNTSGTIVLDKVLDSRFQRGIACDTTTGKVYVSALLGTSVITVPVTIQCFNTSGIEWSTVTLSGNVIASSFDSRVKLDTVNGFLYVNGNSVSTSPQAITKIKI